MPLHRKLNEAIEQVGIGKAASHPLNLGYILILEILKPTDRIDLVDVNLPIFFEEKIHAGHPLTAQGLVGIDRHLLNFCPSHQTGRQTGI